MTRLLLLIGFVVAVLGCSDDANEGEGSRTAVRGDCRDPELPEDMQKRHSPPVHEFRVIMDPQRFEELRDIVEAIAADYDFHSTVRESRRAITTKRGEQAPKVGEIYLFRKKSLKVLCPVNGILVVNNAGAQPQEYDFKFFNPDIVGPDRLESIRRDIETRVKKEMGVQVTELPSD